MVCPQSIGCWVYQLPSSSRRLSDCLWHPSVVAAVDFLTQFRFRATASIWLARWLVLCRLRNRGHLPSSNGWMDRWMVLSAAVLGLGICCRNHVVFESQVKYHKHSLLRVSRATASVANQFPATWYSFLFSVPARKVVLELLSAWIVVAVVVVVDSLSIYAINKQLKSLYNYAASIIEVVCVCPLKTQLPLLPLDFWPGAGRQAGRHSVMQFPLLGTLGSCQLKLKLVITLHSHLSPSPRHFYFRRHFSYNSMKLDVCVSLCGCVCVCA